MDWAPAGAAAVVAGCDVAAVVDVLSFTVPKVIGGNRRAVAKWLLQRCERQPTLRIAVIAAGERWPDGSLRPATEDQWGAGGLIDLLCEAGWRCVAPVAHAAAAAYRAIAHDIPTALGQCASGRELTKIGFADDVRTAAQLDCSGVVPLLRDGAFIPA
jgi:2-phosphosulfolactate phosphatase